MYLEWSRGWIPWTTLLQGCSPKDESVIGWDREKSVSEKQVPNARVKGNRCRGWNQNL
jgi:hypothetical protein